MVEGENNILFISTFTPVPVLPEDVLPDLLQEIIVKNKRQGIKVAAIFLIFIK